MFIEVISNEALLSLENYRVKPKPLSSVINFPSATPSRRLSMSPSSTSLSEHVINELENNRNKYRGGEPATLYRLSGLAHTCIDRLREQVSGGTPGMSSTLTCCIYTGIDMLTSELIIRELLELQQLFTTIKIRSGDEFLVPQIRELFNNFPIKAHDNNMSTTAKLNIRVPENLLHRVHDVGKRLGLSFSDLSILSILLALSDQEIVNPIYRKEFVDSIAVFMRQAKVRLRILECLISELQGQ